MLNLMSSCSRARASGLGRLGLCGDRASIRKTHLVAPAQAGAYPGSRPARRVPWGALGWTPACAGATVLLDCTCVGTYAEDPRYYSYRRATHLGEPGYGREILVIGLCT